jgi:hypothetical protein
VIVSDLVSGNEGYALVLIVLGAFGVLGLLASLALRPDPVAGQLEVGPSLS